MLDITKAVKGNLVLNDNTDYKNTPWYWYLIVILLCFIPIVDIFVLIYLMPKVLSDGDKRQFRTTLYENICNGAIRYLQYSGKTYYVRTSKITPIPNYSQLNDENTISFNNTKFSTLSWAGLIVVLVQLFISNTLGVLGFVFLGYLDNRVGQQLAMDMVIDELVNGKVSHITFPNGEEYDIIVDEVNTYYDNNGTLQTA